MHKFATIKDYYSLLKPGVMSLIVFTGIAGFIVAEGDKNIYLMSITLLAISLASGGAAALNMWYDNDIDKIMTRTKNRPLPLGKILPDDALAYGIILCIIALILIFLSSNLLSAAILLIAISFYVFIYTIWLKRRTSQNIVIGGAAGAFPPLISYVSVTNVISLEAILMFSIIFLWTPPHFWALALYRNEDYKKANIPMLPVVKGVAKTLNQIVLYSILMISSTYVLYFYSAKLEIIYLSATSLANVIFIYYLVKLVKKPNKKTSIKTFIYSIFYLFIIFGAIIIDAFM
ncbi:MAG: protoheme IX farnesyltransferase [Alphaproteobacteria bacterium]|jgi:heme o synthase|nr:protoheme IX farnesyltransferase [Alphaproteobacteria bacterium]